MTDRLFTGFERGPDFDRARTRVATRFSRVRIDLATTCPAEGAVYNVAGDFCYSDLTSSAEVYVEFNSDAPGIAPAIMLSPGTGVDALFSSIRVFWTLGSGIVDLIIATGDRIRPQSAATSILGTTDINIVSQAGTALASGFLKNNLSFIDAANPTAQNTIPLWIVEGAAGTEIYSRDRDIWGSREMGTPMNATSFKSTTLLAANTAETVLAPASNTLGVLVFEAGSLTGNRTGSAYAQLLAKTSAPTTIIDGDAHLNPVSSLIQSGPLAVNTMGMTRPRRSQNGKGLYFIVNLAEVDLPYRQAAYYLF